MRMLRGPPSTGSRADVLLQHALIHSGHCTANDLAVLIAGSTTVAATRINATMRRLGLTDTPMYGGYLVESERRRSISVPLPAPIERELIPKLVNSQPSFGPRKYTTAADLTQLFRELYLGANGRGPLIPELGGEVTPAESRYLLYLLAHWAERGELAAEMSSRTVAHEPGWLSTARHDVGVVYTRRGPFVIAVMNADGVGAPADRLAARLARATLRHLAQR
ncbi:MAG: serine hydrolase [Actinomycetia bacterium]|nr:serine hydrolase [Actinomycetes bacterium]